MREASPRTFEGDGGARGGAIGTSFCAATALGTPFHIDFIGSGSFDQLGAVAAIVLGIGLAAVWLFRRDQPAPQMKPTVAPGIAAAMWDELAACDRPANQADEPAVASVMPG